MIFLAARFSFCEAPNEAFILLTTLYEEGREERRIEFREALSRNISLNHIEKVVVFFEKKTTISSFYDELVLLSKQNPKLKIHDIYSRPMFIDFFNYANKFLNGNKIILANCDIYFDSTLNLIKKEQIGNSFLGLTRWDLDEKGSFFLKDGPFGYCPSQDSWIFLAPVNIKKSDIKFGFLGCDPSIAYSAIKSGYLVFNPSISIKSYHLHKSQIRTYTSQDCYDNSRKYVFLKKTTWNECLQIQNQHQNRVFFFYGN